MLIILGLLALVCYLAIAVLAPSFVTPIPWPTAGLPVLPFLAWMFAASLIWLFACWWMERRPGGKGRLVIVLAFGLMFRIVLLPTPPILDWDVYRCVWDGHVSSWGENPLSTQPYVLLQRIGTGPYPTRPRVLRKQMNTGDP